MRRVAGAGTGDDDEASLLAMQQKQRSGWEERVQRSEAEAAKWHNMYALACSPGDWVSLLFGFVFCSQLPLLATNRYTDLVRAALQDKEERQRLRDQVARTEQMLQSWSEDKVQSVFSLRLDVLLSPSKKSNRASRRLTYLKVFFLRKAPIKSLVCSPSPHPSTRQIVNSIHRSCSQFCVCCLCRK